MNREVVLQIIARYQDDPGMLIPMMQDLQAEYGYLPAEQLRTLAAELAVRLPDGRDLVGLSREREPDQDRSGGGVGVAWAGRSRGGVGVGWAGRSRGGIGGEISAVHQGDLASISVFQELLPVARDVRRRASIDDLDKRCARQRLDGRSREKRATERPEAVTQRP